MNVKQKLVSAKNKVKRNERRILITTAVVATTIVVLQNRGIKSLNQFLEDNNLSDAYYHMDEV